MIDIFNIKNLESISYFYIWEYLQDSKPTCYPHIGSLAYNKCKYSQYMHFEGVDTLCVFLIQIYCYQQKFLSDQNVQIKLIQVLDYQGLYYVSAFETFHRQFLINKSYLNMTQNSYKIQTKQSMQSNYTSYAPQVYFTPYAYPNPYQGFNPIPSHVSEFQTFQVNTIDKPKFPQLFLAPPMNQCTPGLQYSFPGVSSPYIPSCVNQTSQFPMSEKTQYYGIDLKLSEEMKKDQQSFQTLETQKKTEEEKANKNRRGHWTNEEHYKYLQFVRQHRELFKTSVQKKLNRVFKMMSLEIPTRTACQCRSHYSKFNPFDTTQKIRRKLVNNEDVYKKMFGDKEEKKE